MKAVALILTIFLCASAMAQVDYKIPDARKVKMNYKPFPRDFQTQPLQWTDIASNCLNDVSHGNWFNLALKGDKVKFTVHTGSKFGDLKNPQLYIGKVIEERGERKLVEVACIQHSGNDGAFSIEATDLNDNLEHFVLVTSDADGVFYAIETTGNFEPQPKTNQEEEKPQEIIAAFRSIFGRVTDRSGNARKGVKVSLLNEQKETLQSTVSDDRGVFKFEQLPKDEVYMTLIEEDDTELAVEMFLLDSQGKIKNRSSRIGDRLYAFGAMDDAFEQLKLITEKDCKVSLADGKMGIIGKVVDSKTYLFGRPNVKVGLYDKKKILLASSQTDSQGMFEFLDLTGSDYNLKVECDPMQDYAEVVYVDDLSVPFESSNSESMNESGFFQFQALPKDIVELKRMEAKDTKMKLPSDFSVMDKEHPIVLKNILFSTGSATLMTSSHSELDGLVAELKKRADTRIKVSGHTDTRGTASTNKLLSENRAKAVVDYLIAQGISADRLEYIGYGSTKPVATNDTEQGRVQNRRVEFVVID